jgi:hypothetical protein
MHGIIGSLILADSLAYLTDGWEHCCFEVVGNARNRHGTYNESPAKQLHALQRGTRVVMMGINHMRSSSSLRLRPARRTVWCSVHRGAAEGMHTKMSLNVLLAVMLSL